MGDAFRECGVKVHYSIEDNDDTIVSHAASRDGHEINGRFGKLNYRCFPKQTLAHIYFQFTNVSQG